MIMECAMPDFAQDLLSFLSISLFVTTLVVWLGAV
jgi:hypothetical protein